MVVVCLVCCSLHLNGIRLSNSSSSQELLLLEISSQKGEAYILLSQSTCGVFANFWEGLASVLVSLILCGLKRAAGATVVGLEPHCSLLTSCVEVDDPPWT
jgi:hypothetical protein